MKSGSKKSSSAQLELFDEGLLLEFIVSAHKTRFGLHYEFRIDCGSDSIEFRLPHGFSLNPAQARRALLESAEPSRNLAAPESCLPLEGGDKEVLMRWDQGTLEVQGDERLSQSERLAAGLRCGKLNVQIYGAKLHGVWTLEQDRRGWWVKKQKDRFASTRNILRENWSVLTRRPFPLVAAEYGVHDGVRFQPAA